VNRCRLNEKISNAGVTARRRSEKRGALFRINLRAVQEIERFVATMNRMNQTTAERQSIDLKAFDPDQLAANLATESSEQFILARADCEIRLRSWHVGTFSVEIGSFNFPSRSLGEFDRKRVTIGFTRRLKIPSWINGMHFGLDQLLFFPPGLEFNHTAGNDIEWVSIRTTRDALQEAALNRFGRELDLPHGFMLSLPVGRELLEDLGRMIDRTMVSRRSPALMVTPVLGQIAELLFSPQAKEQQWALQRARNRRDQLRKAEEFFRDQVGAPFSSAALSAAMGMSERSVQRLFKSAYGITPQEWSRCLRLHRARRTLQTFDSSVFNIEGVATECGFSHPGRFSIDYRELFGESPSETVLRQIQRFEG